MESVGLESNLMSLLSGAGTGTLLDGTHFRIGCSHSNLVVVIPFTGFRIEIWGASTGVMVLVLRPAEYGS